MKKVCCSFIIALIVVVNAFGIVWTGRGPTNLWTEPLNWEGNSVPDMYYDVYVDKLVNVDGEGIEVSQFPLIDSTVNALVNRCLFNWGSGDGTFEMTGGYFSPYVFQIGSGDGNTVMTMSGGTMEVLGNFGAGGGDIAPDPYGHVPFGRGILNMFGGNIKVSNRTFLPYGSVGSDSAGVGFGLINIYGGTFNAGAASGTLDITFSGQNDSVHFGRVNIAGNSGRFLLHPEQADWRGRAVSLIDRGIITAFCREPNDPDARSHPKAVMNYVLDSNAAVYRIVFTATLPADLNTAGPPIPADHATEQLRCPAMSWVPGDTAISHDIYLGTVFEDVNTATHASPTWKGNRVSTTYAPDALDIDTTYYWRVDEIDGSHIYKGTVWEFKTTREYVIENFENFKDSNSLQSHCAAVGGAQIILSEAKFNSGLKSMQISYSNAASPYYSEAVLTYASGQDWTLNDVKTLVINYHGQKANNAQYMYVQLEDAAGNLSSPVTDGNTALIVQEAWLPWRTWNIALTSLGTNNVNLSSIKKLHIGIGNKSSPSAGGAGAIFVDDVTLYPSRCIGSIAGDTNADCKITLVDFAQICKDWLQSGATITASTPSATGFAVWYKFDEASGTTVANSSGTGTTYNGKITGPIGTGSGTYQWLTTQGSIAGCLRFYDTTSVSTTGRYYVKVPTATFTELGNDITVSCWIYGEPSQPLNDCQLFGFGAGGNNPTKGVVAAYAPDATGGVTFTAGIPINQSSTVVDSVTYSTTNPSDWRDKWNHYAFVKNYANSSVSIYLNGVKVADSTKSTGSLAGFNDSPLPPDITEPRHRIGSGPGWSYYRGRVDDFRIYTRALTQTEIVSLAGKSSVLQPLSATVTGDLNKDNAVDWKDVKILADNWLSIALWP